MAAVCSSITARSRSDLVLRCTKGATIQIIHLDQLHIAEPWREAPPSWRHGWESGRKASGSMVLQCAQSNFERTSKRPNVYALSRPGGSPVLSFEAHWADFDQQGRLVASVGGRVFEGKVKNRISWCQLADFSSEQPERMEAPGWAQKW